MNRALNKILLRLVESFFREYLRQIRGASPHTQRAYADALRLFFLFLAADTGRSVDQLTLDDLTADRTLAFLDHIETSRGNTVSTRNGRLAALRSFFKHLLRHDPTRAGQYSQVLSISAKKTSGLLVHYLEPEEARVLLNEPDQTHPRGLRDYALLLFLYNTGACVSEALAVTPNAIAFCPPFQVRVCGKGRKERICPLWKETARVLKRHIEQQGTRPDQPIFHNYRGDPLTRDGVAHILRKYVTACAENTPAVARAKVTPHTLRHSCAVALLQAGVELTVIRDYLGHASVATTNRYITTNLRMKQKVLDNFWKHAGLDTSKRHEWKPDSELMSFLQSL